MNKLSKHEKQTNTGDAHHLLEVILLDFNWTPVENNHVILFAFNVTDRLPQPKPFKMFGNLLSCGQNEVGQLGFSDDVIERTRPALVVDGSDSKVVDVSAGGMHSKKKNEKFINFPNFKVEFNSIQSINSQAYI